MKMRAVLAVVPLVLLAACSSGDDNATSPSSSAGTNVQAAAGTDGEAGAGEGSSAAPTPGPELPPAAELAEPVDPALMPTASGEFGDKPEVTFPEGDPVPSLQRLMLSEGDGTVAEQGDTVVVDYYGVVWGGTEPFDNSYDRGEPFNFAIGGGVISGWSIGLEGVAEGSRVLLNIPAENGYGAAGAGEDIPGGATLVFVVDVIQVFGKSASAQADAAPQEQDPAAPQVGGAMDAEPTIEFPADVQEPTEPTVTVIGLGTGEPVAEGNLMVQMVIANYDGSLTQSTWPNEENLAANMPVGPQQLQVPAAGTSTQDSMKALEELNGVPLGSRVLITLPGVEGETAADGTPGQGSPAAAVVMDLVGQF